MGLPLVVNICSTVLGWGPALTVFWWKRRLSHYGVRDWSWRFVSIEIGRFEVNVQWI